MDQVTFSQMAQYHGLRLLGPGRALGVERGYFIDLAPNGKKDLLMHLWLPNGVHNAVEKPVKNALKSALGKLAKPAWADDNTLAVYITVDAMSDPYAEGVVRVLDCLREAGVPANDACSVCGRPGYEMAVPRGDGYAPVHHACMVAQVEGVRQRSAKNVETGSYLLGFVGALLGMIVGILPSLITIIAMQRIVVVLFMLIPLCIYGGYKLLKGKMNAAALVLSILLSVVGLFLLVFTSDLWLAAAEYGASFGQVMEILPEFVTDPEIWAAVVGDSNFLMCALFTALGIFLAWGRISRTGKKDVKDAEDVLKTAVPLVQVQPGANYAAYPQQGQGTEE